MKLLFFHVGPGMNSNPEKHLLSDLFKEEGFDLKLWNEPSLLRNANINSGINFFQQYLESAEEFFLHHFDKEPLVIIGHSFGAHAVRYLVHQHPEKIKKVIFISSGLALKNIDTNIFTFTLKDFEENGDYKQAAILKKVLKNYTGSFDDNTKKGYETALQNLRLFSYYFLNKEKMVESMQFYEPREFGIDVEAFFKVRQSWFDKSFNKTNIPAIGIFGKFDIVVSNKIEQSILQQQFNELKIYEFNKSSHFPHLEETEQLIKILRGITAI